MKNSKNQKYAYLNTESRANNDGKQFAQIVIRTGPVQDVAFDVIHDRNLNMGYEAKISWQRAGEYKRKTCFSPFKVYTQTKGDFIRVTHRISTAATASGGYRYHLVGPLQYVMLEGTEVQEMLDRINACEKYNDRNPTMLAYARELTSGQVG